MRRAVVFSEIFLASLEPAEMKSAQQRQRAADRRWYENNREKKRVAVAAYRKQNRNKVAKWARSAYRRLQVAAIALLGGPVCKLCGATEQPTKDGRTYLEIDHVNGGGAEHRQRASGQTVLRYVLKHPDEFQVLCGPCNIAKAKKERVS
jgi:hypothetical protein